MHRARQNFLASLQSNFLGSFMSSLTSREGSGKFYLVQQSRVEIVVLVVPPVALPLLALVQIKLFTFHVHTTKDRAKDNRPN